MESIGFPVVLCDPEAILLGDGVGAARVERSVFALRHFLYFAKKFGGGCLIESRIDTGLLDCIQNPQYAQCIGIGGIFRHFK